MKPSRLEAAARRRRAPRTIRELSASPPRASAQTVCEALCARGWLIPRGPGLVGLAGGALALARALDRAWLRAALERFEAASHAYPALIPASVLERGGYLASFPQLALRVSNLDAPLCVAPSVCFHCYAALGGQQVPGPGRAVTAAGRCGRSERGRGGELARLSDFEMREWIFLGEGEWVRARRDEAVDVVLSLAARWGLGGAIETASDPFFGPGAEDKSFWQASAELKYELRAPLAPEPGESLAIASFNLHETFFADRFAIRMAEGEPAHTGCVGFGVERWVLACFVQHGLSPAGWPASLKAAVWRDERGSR